MHFQMIFRDFGRCLLQLGDQPFQSAGVFLARHQNGILRRHHHEVVHALESDDCSIAGHIAIGRALEHGGALCSIAFSVLAG